MFEKIKCIYRKQARKNNEGPDRFTEKILESNRSLMKRLDDLKKERESHILSYLDDNSGYVRIGNQLVLVTVTRIDRAMIDCFEIECVGAYSPNQED